MLSPHGAKPRVSDTCGFAQHLGERGDTPQCKESLLKGETARKRLAIPMFMGTVM
jgi:hypothetical protein